MNGERISIKEAKQKGYLRRTDKPVVQMRAFGTRARIQDVNHRNLEDARGLVARELSVETEAFSPQAYLEWFAETLGQQLAILHNAGYGHQYLSGHNITLDCRIVDLDSVFPLEPAREDAWYKRTRELQEDFRDSKSSLQDLRRWITDHGFLTSHLMQINIDVFDYSREIDDIFDKSYFHNLKQDWRVRPRFGGETKEQS